MKIFKRLLIQSAGFAAMLAATNPVAAQPAPDVAPLLHQTFEEGNNLWVAFGPGSQIGLTREAANVKQGQVALRFDYTVEKGQYTALVLPTPQGVPPKVKSFRFWIKSDYPTTLVMALQEANGGRYLAVFNAAQDTWQQVELAPADFILSEDADDPKDPDNKLDFDQVQAMAIGDLKDLFAQSPNPDLTRLLNVELGPHTFYLDDVAIGESKVAEVFGIADGNLEIDDFVHPQLSWITIGDVRLSRVEDKTLNDAPDGRVLQAAYHQAPGAVAGFIKRVPRQKFVGLQHLAFDVTSAKPATLLVQVEEKGGGKYNTRVEVPGNNALKHVAVAFKDLKAAEDSHDANGQLDLDQVQQLLILDAGGAALQTEQDNTLHVGRLRGTTAP